MKCRRLLAFTLTVVIVSCPLAAHAAAQIVPVEAYANHMISGLGQIDVAVEVPPGATHIVGWTGRTWLRGVGVKFGQVEWLVGSSEYNRLGVHMFDGAGAQVQNAPPMTLPAGAGALIVGEVTVRSKCFVVVPTDTPTCATWGTVYFLVP